jgi:Flp pilus assembly protein TadG
MMHPEMLNPLGVSSMLRRFLADRRGNFMMMTAAAIVPIMGGLALAVDYAEMSRQRQLTLNALDAAGVATARRFVEGATETELKTYAQNFFKANLGGVDPANATLHITLPNNQQHGGGTVVLTADLKYAPYFLPAFTSMIGGNETGAAKLDFNARSEVQLKNAMEVSLVLDNSGSMDYNGSGSGKKRITLLKDASKQLVDALALTAGQIKQVDKPIQFALVPFAASVNVGPSNATATWMDTDGRSPVHHENFDWTTMTGTKKVELVGGVYTKKGTGWGTEENQKVTRFTLYSSDIKRITGTTKVASGTGCVDWYWWGGCKTYGTTYTDVPVYGPLVNWAGCVETRPHPYNTNDAAPVTGTPATLFVPMFSPDETDNRDNSNRQAWSWLGDDTNSSSNLTRQRNMTKYFKTLPQGTSALTGSDGPNQSCTTNPITPLTDVTVAAGKTAIKAAIDAMAPNGGTNVPEGIAWGWRTVSGGAPFTEGRPDTENGVDKIVIVLTDGENTYYTPNSLGYNNLASNQSIYSAYGYVGTTQSGGTTTRLFMGTDSGVSKSGYDNDNYSKALNQQMAATCGNAKTAGVIVMTVALDLSTSDTQQKAQIDALKSCSSDSRFRRDPSDASKPAKLFWNTTGGNLEQTFKEIADELSNLRITS